MRITLILVGYYLKNKYPSSTIELNYSKPVTIRQALKDAKISPADVFFISPKGRIPRACPWGFH